MGTRPGFSARLRPTDVPERADAGKMPALPRYMLCQARFVIPPGIIREAFTMWDLALPLWNVAIRVGMAVLFGALIGFDRERRGKAAGMRTLMLVSLGAATFVIAGEEVVASTPGADRPATLFRLIAAVITGIGFLGAGTIMRDRGRVEGVTTAAAIWVTTGVGVLCGLGEIILATFSAVVAIATLTVVRLTEKPIASDIDDM